MLRSCSHTCMCMCDVRASSHVPAYSIHTQRSEGEAMNPGDKRALHANCSDGKRPRCVYSSMQVYADLRQLIRLLEREQHIIESSIRPVVAKEIDRTVSRMFGPVQERFPLQQIAESPARKFQLQFKTNPAARCFTENVPKDEQGRAICVILIDAATGQHVTKGPESLATLEVVALVGDFCTSEKQEWSAEEFERHVAKEREGRGPLLVGDLKVCLRDGQGTLGQMCFTDNSSFTRSKTFRLGVRVARDDEHRLMSIREGKSKAFAVIDIRGKAYKKHDTPSPTDAVWRLLNIRKDGSYHKKLRLIGINTVKDFLSCLETEPRVLKDVLGKMSEKAYQGTIKHAKKCMLSEELSIYPVEQPPYKGTLVSDANYQVAGIGLEKLAGIEKVHFDGLLESECHKGCKDVTGCSAIQDFSGSSMIDGLFADNTVGIAAAPQVVDGSCGTHGVLTMELTTEGDVEGNGIMAWASLETWSEHEQCHLDDEVASQMQLYVGMQEYGEPFEPFAHDDPNPPAGRWWPRIRSVVCCAVFIRRARFARHLVD